MNELLLHCRPGFEIEAAAEIEGRASACGVSVQTRQRKGAALVEVCCADAADAELLMRSLEFRRLIFIRQWARGSWLQVDPVDRITPVIQACARGPLASCLWLETADSNEGKAMAALLHKLEGPLARHLEKTRFVRPKREDLPRLHVLAESGVRLFVGWSWADNAAAWPMGIPRLRMPREAPSRSTLKLEEAWHHFIPRDEWDSRLAPGMTAVDLGAAPGGWTWQLVNRHMKVVAVDNGPMDRRLMDSGQVEHVQADGYLYRPRRAVDWMVCDIVEKPARSSALLAQWLTRGWCREAVINFKLPMKQRYLEVQRCLEHVHEALEQSGMRAELNCRQLYTDREEVTCHARRLK